MQAALSELFDEYSECCQNCGSCIAQFVRIQDGYFENKKTNQNYSVLPQHIYNLLVAFMNENLINQDYSNNNGYPLCIEAVGILADVARSLSLE